MSAVSPVVGSMLGPSPMYSLYGSVRPKAGMARYMTWGFAARSASYPKPRLGMARPEKFSNHNVGFFD